MSSRDRRDLVLVVGLLLVMAFTGGMMLGIRSERTAQAPQGERNVFESGPRRCG